MKVEIELVRPTGTERRLLGDGSYIIGREVGDLVLADPRVSTRHGQLQVGNGRVSFTDLNSTNGSYLDGVKVSSEVSLARGSCVMMGETGLRISAISQDSVTAAGTQIMQARAAAPVAHGAPAPVSPLKVAPAPVAVAAAAPTLPEMQPSANPSKVRHSYPLAIRDAGFSTALGLLMKTLPYTLARFGILVAVSVATIIWFTITLGGMAWLGQKSSFLGWTWALVGFGGYGWIWHTLVRYGLHLLKAGHIAVLTELITKGSIGSGQEGMFDYGKKIVKDQFGQVNVMFGLDLLIKGIVRAFNRTLNWISGLIPIPGLQSVTGIVNRVVYNATTYVDETIFSYNLARGDDNVWRSSREGVIYYAQNSKEVLKTGIYIVILDYLLSAVAWIAMLAPAFVLSMMLPKSVIGAGSVGIMFIAVLFAANFRAAFIRPLFLTMIMVKFHTCVQGQEINEEWDQKLSGVSSKFRELTDKARGYVAPRESTQGASAQAV